MRLMRSGVVFVLLCLCSVLVKGETGIYEIETGEVHVSPGFCPPGACTVQTATLSGRFQAVLGNQEIHFAEVAIRSSPDVGFVLPEQPVGESGGTVKRIEYTRDDDVLMLSGAVDMRAFDGPLYEYRIQAKLKEDQPEAPEETFDAQDYYLIELDLRRCIWPQCGGVYAKPVNQRRMRCTDGSYAQRCRFPSVDWSLLGESSLSTIFSEIGAPTLLVKAQVLPREYEGFGNLGYLIIEQAFRPATSNPPEGYFYGVKNNGIVCITSPCFSGTQYTLNSRRERALSGVDLNPVGAGNDDTEQAYRIFSESVLLAAGKTERRRELNGRGTQFVANQFYLPIKAQPPRQCGKGYEWRDERCLTPNDCEAPLLELTTIGGAAFIDPVTGEEQANIQYSCVETCDSPATETGPGRCTLALP